MSKQCVGKKAFKAKKISRPPNAFMLFGRERRPALAKDNPELGNKEISKILGLRWHSLGAEEKQSYQDLAKRVSEQHKQRYPDYSYSPVLARRKKAEKKRQDSQKRQEDIGSLALLTDTNTIELLKAGPAPQEYNKFVIYQGLLIPFEQWERGHRQPAVNLHADLAAPSQKSTVVKCSESSHVLQTAGNRFLEFVMEQPESSVCETKNTSVQDNLQQVANDEPIVDLDARVNEIQSSHNEALEESERITSDEFEDWQCLAKDPATPSVTSTDLLTDLTCSLFPLEAESLCCDPFPGNPVCTVVDSQSLISEESYSVWFSPANTGLDFQ